MENEESKIDDNMNQMIFNNQRNKLIDSKDFFFNYRNDEAFNKINILETKPINKNYNYENYFSFNPTLNYNSIRLIKNEHSYQINNKNENIYNNKMRDMKFNELKNSVNSINSMQMREISEEEKEIQNQIKYEENILKKLKEEKNKLIEEERKRRDMIFIEINNNKNKMEEKKEEIKEILYECKKEKKDLKINENKDLNLNMKNENYYYNDYLQQIQQIRERNELINKNSNKMIMQNIKKENNISNEKMKNYNIYNNSYNQYKKITKMNNSYNNKYPLKINLSYNNNSIKRIKKERKEISNKINLNSYFQLSEKEKEKKLNNTSIDNLNKNDSLNEKKKFMNLTPVGLYRTNNTDNIKDNPNKIYKILSSNKNNFMTQTRFYRSRINPDELISNYAKEKAISNINSSRNKNFANNKNIFNYQKINHNNFRMSQPNTPLNYINRIEKRKSYNKYPFEKIYFNYSNNLNYNQNKKLSLLKKGESYSRVNELKESENNKFLKINFNDNKSAYLCDNCLREKILLNEN